MASISTSSVPNRSQEEYLRLGREISDSIKKDMLCSQDIVDQSLIDDSLSTEENHKQIGDRYWQSLSRDILIEEARAACRMAAMQIFGRVPVTILNLSVAKFGVGHCSEIASKVSFECIKQSLPAQVIYCSEQTSFARTHGFMVLDPDHTNLVNGRNPLEALTRSKRGVIVDPFFNIVCPVADVRGTALETYLKKKNIKVIYNSELLPRLSEEEIKEAESNVDKVYKVAAALIKDPKWIIPETCRKKEIVYRMTRQEKLNGLLPEVVWREAKNLTLWTRASQEKAQQVCNAINAHFNIALIPQRVKDSEDYVVAIDRATLLSMRVG